MIQFQYLFGGRAHIEKIVPLTLATYARRGFFELATVAVLVLPMLWSADWLVKRESQPANCLFRALCAGIVLMMVCIIASALHRMWIYVQSFGLTELRVYTTAFMLMLAVIFIWFAATVLRGARDPFTTGVIVVGFVSLLCLETLNPDALIAETNLRQTAQRRDLDPEYLARLSLDAAPVLMSSSPSSSPEIAKAPILRIDWRSWTWARHQAAKYVRAR